MKVEFTRNLDDTRLYSWNHLLWTCHLWKVPPVTSPESGFRYYLYFEETLMKSGRAITIEKAIEIVEKNIKSYLNQHRRV